MKNIETQISPLISNLFPAFYKEEGQNFISFVKAYYEWLEQNFQLLTLESNVNFNVGDTVTQSDVTGKLVSFVGEDALILVDGLNTFKCLNVCNELIPITSSSGGSTYILRGGTTKRLGNIFLSRNLGNIRDIDKTVDIFIVKFKEKYLKNIDFDTATNKQLLVKNSLDLYRSKGTERSIDLFFKLVYGVDSKVYYPGDDLFMLSAANWVKPQYLEISSDTVDRAIELIGKQITGVTSNATGFVEKYIKRKVQNGFVHILYLTNVTGNFIPKEIIKDKEIFSDSPRVVGSLSKVIIESGSADFKVGDIISFSSVTGDKGIARVTDINDDTGFVSFDLIEGGWGFTVSTGGSSSSNTQTIISENILYFSNAQVGNTVSDFTISTAGLGYSNTDIITLVSNYTNASARPITNNTGGVVWSSIISYGSGFFGGTPQVVIANSTGGTSLGSGLTVTPVYKKPTAYFQYMETVKQKLANIVYDAAANNTAFVAGAPVLVSNNTTIVSSGSIVTAVPNVGANGIMTVALTNNAMVQNNFKIVLASNNLVTANVKSFEDSSASANVMSLPIQAFMNVGIPRESSVFSLGDTVYQVDTNNEEIGSGKITAAAVDLTGGSIQISDLKGVFAPGQTLLTYSNTAAAPLTNIDISVGVHNISNTFTTVAQPEAFSLTSGTRGYISSIGSGTDAQFKVGNPLLDKETIKLNTDLLTSNNILSRRLNSSVFGFSKTPAANISTNIFSSLSFSDFEVGTITVLSDINPGIDYNMKPTSFVYQPYMFGYDKHDYILTIANQVGSFALSELIQQTIPQNNFSLVVANAAPFVVGERTFTSNTTHDYVANGTVVSVSISPSSNTVVVKDIEGTFSSTHRLRRFSNPSSNSVISSVAFFTSNNTAQAKITNIVGNTLYAKRIQFENNFSNTQPITGVVTGATANLLKIDYDYSTDPIGFNSNIELDVFAANGTVTEAQVLDSGFGFTNGQIATFPPSTRSISGTSTNGTVTVIVDGLGFGSGYYRSSKGFLSSFSKVHDGDYYQEYSYDVMSRIPLDKYASMFKKVMHTAGTRFFGSVLIDSESSVAVTTASSEVEISEASPYVVFDRGIVTIEDRGSLEIEIRD